MDSKPKWTPGPWTICKAYQNEFTRTVPIKVGSAPAYTICEVLGAPKGNLADINARLIAAAPDMAEALALAENAVAAFHYNEQHDRRGCQGEADCDRHSAKVLRTIRAALAKARGRE